MTAINPLPLTDRFALLIAGLRNDVAAAGTRGSLGPPLTVLLWGRLNRKIVRFAAVLDRYHAGTLPDAGGPRHWPEPARLAASPSPAVLPRRGAWVVRVLPGAAVWRAEIEKMLDDAELAAIVAGAPQIGRALRPLCRMLGIKPRPGLALPRRPRPKAARAVERGRLRLPIAAAGWEPRERE